MNCPLCGLERPPSASRCDCGYEFEKGQVEPGQKPEERGEEEISHQSLSQQAKAISEEYKARDVVLKTTEEHTRHTEQPVRQLLLIAKLKAGLLALRRDGQVRLAEYRRLGDALEKLNFDTVSRLPSEPLSDLVRAAQEIDLKLDLSAFKAALHQERKAAILEKRRTALAAGAPFLDIGELHDGITRIPLKWFSWQEVLSRFEDLPAVLEDPSSSLQRLRGACHFETIPGSNVNLGALGLVNGRPLGAGGMGGRQLNFISITAQRLGYRLWQPVLRCEGGRIDELKKAEWLKVLNVACVESLDSVGLQGHCQYQVKDEPGSKVSSRQPA